MKRIHKIISITSMILGFVMLVVLVNYEILDGEDLSIMYWGLGFIALWYVLLWVIVAKVALGIYHKIKSKFNGH